jgi:16S rRNA (guanine(527)-N(7))-methyltransferase RsmG
VGAGGAGARRRGAVVAAEERAGSRDGGIPRELAAAGFVVSAEVADRLAAHRAALRRMSIGVSLVGPGAEGELVSRHYGEALAALAELPAAGRLLDVGSGAGFPGLVLAAARPDLEVHLVEPATKKVAFLRVAARQMGLRVFVHGVGVEQLPAELGDFAVVTSRAFRLAPELLAGLLPRLRPGGRLLLWVGAQDPVVPGFRVVRERRLGGERRRLVVLERFEVDA